MTLSEKTPDVITYGHKKSTKTKLTLEEWKSIVQTPTGKQDSTRSLITPSRRDLIVTESVKASLSPLVNRWKMNSSIIKDSCYGHLKREDILDLQRDSDDEESDELWNEIQRNLQTDRIHVHSGSFKIRESPKDLAEENIPSQPTKKVSVSLEDLLGKCDQTTVYSFEELIGQECIDKSKKLGESSYAEVFQSIFQGQSVALKIVPFEETTLKHKNTLSTTSILDLYQEIAITKLLCDETVSMGTIPAHFIKSEKIGICRGHYPEIFLREWDLWKSVHVSENQRPDVFDENQLFAVFILENGGMDLEHCELQTIEQAKSIIFQVIASLHWAESAFSFEHRDLHLGNILLKPLDETVSSSFEYILKRNHGGLEKFILRNNGAKLIIIDYTLSRLQTNTELFYVDMIEDEFFNGQGDLQYDVYRWMRQLVINGSDWKGFYPKTNLFWVQYLVHQLSLSKDLIKQSDARSSRSLKKQFRDFSNRILQAERLDELLDDMFFSEVIEQTMSTSNEPISKSFSQLHI